MQEKLLDFLNLIFAAQQIPSSQDQFLELINQIYSNHNILQFYLMMIESNDENFGRFLCCMPNIIEKVIALERSQFFLRNQSFFECITNMFISGYDIQNVCKLWVQFECFFHSPEALSVIFQSLLELLEINIKTDFQDVATVQRFSWIYHSLVECRIRWPIGSEFPIQLEDFTTSFFPNFFVDRHFDINELIEPTFVILKDVFQLIQFSLPYFIQTPVVIERIFSFLTFLSTFGNERPILSNISTTQQFIKITEEIRDFLYILPKLATQYPEVTFFISQIQLPVLELSQQCAIRTVNSFPNDLYMTISANILSILFFLLEFDPSTKNSLYQKYFDVLLQISYLYSELPEEIKKQLTINPLVYYENAYLNNDNRFFTAKIIENLMNINSEAVINFLLTSEPNNKVMFLIGSIYESNSDSHFLQSITEKVLQLIACPICLEDKLYFMTQVSSLLQPPQTEDLFNLSVICLEKFKKGVQDENITEFHRFYFTLACRAIHCLLSIQYNHQNIFEYVELICHHCEHCVTSDGIMILYKFCSLSSDNFRNFMNHFFDILISIVNQNLSDSKEYAFVDSKIVNSVFEIIKNCFSIENVLVPCDKMMQFISTLYQHPNIETIDSITADIFRSAASNNYKFYPQLLTHYFTIHQNSSFESINFDFFVPFFLFMSHFRDDFLNWDVQEEYVSFILSRFEKEYNKMANLIEDDEFEDIELVYYFSQAVCMLILLPGCLNDDVLHKLVDLIVPQMQGNPEFILSFIFFDIIASIIYRQKTNPFPEMILQLLIKFILQGFVFRVSDRIRYSKALEIALLNTENEEIRECITQCLSMLSNEIPMHQIYEEEYDWFLDQPSIGLNSEPIPFGYET